MDSATVVVTIISIVTAKGCGLLGLWLRLRWRVQQELARQRCLTGALRAAGAGGRLEVETSGMNGQLLRMRLLTAPAGKARGGV
ncbi:hypothetical protein [Streptomyces sp. CBMA152]|uniref:hypothetical protein n=1 Tax=Streptomyces sp. CBMA152 TaxID=1896312 RepID=UPI0016606B5A|nr:hypothetical protein [Streptomyces sp. CBMA152]MBD0742941.1 hypothetical protein [Streptomyces sp. CBMA152]